MYDFAAKTSCRDAERAENFNNEMYALRWSDSLSIFLCERCAAVVTRPFCGRLNAWKNQSGVKDAEVEGIPRRRMGVEGGRLCVEGGRLCAYPAPRARVDRWALAHVLIHLFPCGRQETRDIP